MKCLRPLILGLSFLAPVIACTSNVVNQASNDPCTELAAKCPKCTVSSLAQTCNAAVSSHDPSSCQNGLDDHDIQINCVSGGGGVDSGPPGNPDTGAQDTGPGQQDTGPGQPDTGPGPMCSGGDVCIANCQLGNCQSCVSQGSCVASCEGHACQMTCEGNASCTYSCPGGGCTLACLGNASCDMSCPGGGCTFRCATTGTCATSCSGGGCLGP